MWERCWTWVRNQLNDTFIKPQISISCITVEKKGHIAASVSIKKPFVTTVARQVTSRRLAEACASWTCKKQHLEWHVEEESSQDELQLLVKSRFIPYGQCTCSLRIDSSKFCSRRWFIADEYPQISRSGRYNVLRSVLWVIINKIPFVPCEIMCVWSSLWSICPLYSLYLLKSMCPLCSLCLLRSVSPLYFLFLVRLVCPLCTRNTVDTRSSILPNTRNTLDTRISPNTTNTLDTRISPNTRTQWTQGSHQTKGHSGHTNLTKHKKHCGHTDLTKHKEQSGHTDFTKHKEHSGHTDHRELHTHMILQGTQRVLLIKTQKNTF